MSLLGLFDARIVIYKIDDNTTSALGEPNPIPVRAGGPYRATLQVLRISGLAGRDDGAGQRPTTRVMVFAEKQSKLGGADIFQVVSGPNLGTMWVCGDYFENSRARHLELDIHEYIGPKPHDCI